MKLTSTPLAMLAAVAGLAAAAAASQAQGQSGYPNRMIRIIVPTSSGGAGDTIARFVAQRLTERYGRQVVVENRVGAGTIIGSDAVAKAAPDGYTLLMGLSTLATNPATYRKMPYDALRDFAPVAQVVVMSNLMVIHPSLPAKSVKDLIALARAQPGAILYASSGHGTNPHLSIELFCSMAGIRMVHVPYKSSIPGLIDVIAGQVALTTSPMLQAMPHVRTGKVRALGVTSANRVAAAPAIPTVAESGLPGYASVQWYGLLAPAKTPREIVDKLYQDVAAILRTPDARERFAADGAEPALSSPDTFAAFIKVETVKWAAVARAAGIVPE